MDFLSKPTTKTFDIQSDNWITVIAGVSFSICIKLCVCTVLSTAKARSSAYPNENPLAPFSAKQQRWQAPLNAMLISEMFSIE